MGKSKAHRIKGLTGPKVPLGDQINEGRVSKKPKAHKVRLRAEEEDFVDSRTTKKILHQARKQQAELNLLDDSFGPSLAESAAAASAGSKRRHRLGDPASSDESDEEYREEADVDAQDFFDDIKINAEDERALEMFQNKDGVKTRTLAEMIMDKITEKQTEIQTQFSDTGSLKMEEVDPRVREMYEGVRDVLKRYRSGRFPKAFKIVPKLRNWEQILYITEPHNWSAAAMFQATRIFSSGLTQYMAQRFYNLVLLPRIRDDLVFLLSGMFMLGLENTKIFSFLMVSGVVSLATVIAVVAGLRGNFELFTSEAILPKGVVGLLSGAALASFSFSNDLLNGNYCKRLLGLAVILAVLLSNELIGACLTAVIKFSTSHDYEAVPMLAILENKDFHKAIAAVACLLVLTCSGALLELFPEMFYHIVQLTTSDWKILAKQIGYENRDSGSPILAVFTGGSLCAMLAFACPMENLTYILAASHLMAACLRAFYLLYIPFRPQYMEQQNESSLAYSRLNTAPKAIPTQSTSLKTKKPVWFFRKPSTASIAHHMLPNNRANKNGPREEHEREWLLLGEPPSPKAPDSPPNVESTILSDQVSDIECIALAKPENTDTDEESSTDIDAIVDEYRQKVKVSAAGPLDNNTLRLPSAASWRLTLVFIALILTGSVLTSLGLMVWETNTIIVGVNLVFIPSAILMLFPKYDQTTSTTPATLTSTITLLGSTILYSASFLQSWPALLLWFMAGLFLFIRCDTWCCLCLERPPATQTLIASVSGTRTTIRVPRPPKGSIIPSRIAGHS